MNEELQTSIPEGLKSGSHPKDIRKELVDAGWDDGQVDVVLSGVSQRNPKRLGVVVAISLLAVGGVAGTTYFVVKAVKKNVPSAAQTPVVQVSPTPPAGAVSPQPSPTAQSLGDETANWKEYRNVDLRFTLHHPEDWKISIQAGSGVSPGQIILSSNSGNDFLVIAPLANPNEAEALLAPDAKVSELIIAGKRAKVFAWSGNLRVSEQSPEPQPVVSEIIIFSEPEQLSLSLIHANTLLNNPDLGLVNLKKVLKTFTFIPPALLLKEVSWKSFENGELSFRVEYPDDWTLAPKHIGFGLSNQFLLAQKPFTLEQKQARYIAIELHVDEPEAGETAQAIIMKIQKTSRAAAESVYTEGATTIGGHPAYQYTVRQLGGPDSQNIAAIVDGKSYILYIDAGSITDPVLTEILKRFVIIP